MCKTEIICPTGQPNQQNDDQQRVLVVGAGAAGMACAWSLSRFPEKFSVQVWDKAERAGGVATTEDVGNGLRVNDGVQGGSTSYRNTLLLHETLGIQPVPASMKVSFGKDDKYWNNYGKENKTELISKLQSEIKRFGTILKWISRLEPLFVAVPIGLVLRLFRFSDDFQNHMVLPLTALFFGTGNQQPRVSAAIFARVFLDPQLRLFDYDPELLLSSSPKMFAFTTLRDIYEKMVASCEKVGDVQFCFGRAAMCIKRHADYIEATDDKGVTRRFDQVVFAGDAEQTLKILDSPRWAERKVLGNVKYYNDITITHTDEEYMKKHYDVDLENRQDQYYIKTYKQDPGKIEMSFLLNNYQPHLKDAPVNVYQTLCLDDRDAETLWTMNEINEEKVLLKKWWRQFSHSWSHYAFTVPFVRFLQGKQRSWFCGAYTLANTHEVATISGLAVAERLGAPYPFMGDDLAALQYRVYMKYIHGK